MCFYLYVFFFVYIFFFSQIKQTNKKAIFFSMKTTTKEKEFFLLEKQICGYLPPEIELTQYKIGKCIISIFKRQNPSTVIINKVIYYFCGYSDYFFHYHLLDYSFDIVVIDLPGFGFNKEYETTNPYSEGKYFNYYDDIGQIVRQLDIVFETLDVFFKVNEVYTEQILYGHSTGGHIILSYISETKQTRVSFHKMVLNSPLTRFFFPPISFSVFHFKFSLDINFCLYYFLKVLGYVSKEIDLRAILKGKKSDISSSITLVNNLIHHIQKNENSIDLKFTSNIGQPMLLGWINCVHNQTEKMKNNSTKITVPTVLICSKSFKYNLKEETYDTDEVLQPRFIISDIKPENLLVYKKNTGHDVLLEPENDNDNESWKDYFEIMFLK